MDGLVPLSVHTISVLAVQARVVQGKEWDDAVQVGVTKVACPFDSLSNTPTQTHAVRPTLSLPLLSSL